MGKVNEMKVEPTLDDPKSDQAIEFQDKFDDEMKKHQIHLTEVDTLLNEKEQSLKKKIFDLDKMEALVHSDPKLSSVYDDMAEDGKEKYGYHYNETIMNIIFNEYILNSSKYIQKYKSAVPKKKKRRDKSGINQLRKGADDLKKREKEIKQDVEKQNTGINEASSTVSGGNYAFEKPLGYTDDIKNVSKEIDTEKEKKDMEKVEVALPGKEKRAYGKFKPAGYGVSNPTGKPTKNDKIKKPFYPGGNVINKTELNENTNLELIKNKAQQISKEEGVAQHVNIVSNDNYTVSDFFDSENTVVSYENGRELNENEEKVVESEDSIEETTSAGSSGSYVGPAAWSKSGKTMITKPIWKGGTVIAESDYITDPTAFGEYFNQLNEEINRDQINGFDQIMSKLEMNRSIDAETVMNVANSNNIEFGDLMGMIGRELQKRTSSLNEKAVSQAQQRFMGMVHAFQKGELKSDDVSNSIKKAADSMTDKEAEDFASTKHKGLPEKVDEIGDEIPDPVADAHKEYETSSDRMYASDDWVQAQRDAEGVDETIVDNQEDSMRLKNIPLGTGMQNGGVPVGLQITPLSGGMTENKNNIDMDKDLEKLNKDLALLEMHHNKLKELSEDKKTGSLVNKDRLGKENETNFKDDLNHSGTKEIIDVTKELEWKDQQTDVPSDPQKLGKDIEKEVIKNTEGDAFKDEGNSANDKGDEITKRNLTDEETNEVDLYRKGLGDYVFDNKPDERYEERMKADMGDKNYEMRQKRMEFNANAPMYNKDTQPVEDGIEKDQFDKAKSGWNDRMGLKESIVTGKYHDTLNKKRLMEFKLGSVTQIDVILEGLFPVTFEGLGNIYNNKGELNEGVKELIESYGYYTDGENIYAMKSVQNLNESEQKGEKSELNEQMDKIKHLIGYKPKNFTNTKSVKENRGF
jgi:uncharacterized protein DUF3008